MIIKNLSIRCKQIDFVNDFRNIQFQLKPIVNFHVGRLSETVYSAMCEIKIEADQTNDMPIRANYLVEGLFEFVDGTTEEEANLYIKKSGIESVYSYTRSIVSTSTALAGIQSINLPIINFAEGQPDQTN